MKAIHNISYGKAVGLDEIPVEVWKLDDFNEFLLESCYRVYFQETIVSWTSRYILPFLKKETFPSQQKTTEELTKLQSPQRYIT